MYAIGGRVLNFVALANSFLEAKEKINKKLEKKIINKIIKPTLNALKDLGNDYSGFLYAGLMIKNNNPYLIEYNVRMGDPECQVILPLLKSNFLELVLACNERRLEDFQIKWKKNKSMCIVLCSKGYPDKYKKNIEIKNLAKIKENKNNYLFHAGTNKKGNKFYSTGGRVLNFVNIASSFLNSRNNIISLIKKLNWNNGFYRKDIGHRVID